MPSSGTYEVKNIFGKVVWKGSSNEAYVKSQYPEHAYTYTVIKLDKHKEDEYKQWMKK